MDIEKICFENYKCFSSVEIEEIRKINIIIGKNNIGKSSILDIIEMIYNPNKLFSKKDTRIFLQKKLIESDISRVFPKNTSGGGIVGNHYSFGSQYVGKSFVFELKKSNGVISNVLYEKLNEFDPDFDKKYDGYWRVLSQKISFNQRITKRMTAERDVFPEEEGTSMEISENGEGVTRVISNFLNKDIYNEDLVKVELLNRLNEIMGEDGHFTEIVTQQIDDNGKTKWEIFLREESKGRIPLSASGSGLKTILVVLVYSILIPEIENNNLSDYIFMFEEIENNLHPSLQRRLLRYIEELTDRSATVFLTTHSNVLLDNFQNNDNVNILHVKKEGNLVSLANASNNIHKNQILNDLGIRASDLLQSNGVIWVEGPSDRIYINKWIELWSSGSFKEGKDYQCVFYGGRLLSHLEYQDDEITDLINLLKVNRNSIIVIDSDKENSSKRINKTKARIRREAEEAGVMCWITEGREIENYVPVKLMKEHLNTANSSLNFDKFDKCNIFLDALKDNEGQKFLSNKVGFARAITNISSKNDFIDMYDLDSRVTEIIENIKMWNNK